MKNVTRVVLEKDKNTVGESKTTLWKIFGNKLNRLNSQLEHNRALAFAFVEGALVRALRQGKSKLTP